MASPAHLDGFVRAVHRRMVLLRVLERVGVLLTAGCAVAAGVIVLAAWRGGEGLAAALAILGAAVAGGFVLSFVRRPGRLEAAMEADRQLGLDDLLATAWLLEHRPVSHWREEWVLATRLMAERACRGRSPSELVLNRLGARAWGGIGLATAVVLAAGVLLSPSAGIPAEGNGAFLGSREAAEVQRLIDEPVSGAAAWQRVEADQPAGLTGEESALADIPPAGTLEENGWPHEGVAAGASATDGGSGAGIGQTPAAPPEVGQQRVASTPAVADGIGEPAAGTGSPDAAAMQNEAAAGASTAALADPVTPAAPWQADTWPADRAAAQRAARQGQVPDRHRDLLRGYFTTEPPAR